MSEKMDYRAEVRELAWSYDYPISLTSRDDLTAAILALLDKVRQAQAAEMIKLSEKWREEVLYTRSRGVISQCELYHARQKEFLCQELEAALGRK